MILCDQNYGVGAYGMDSVHNMVTRAKSGNHLVVYNGGQLQETCSMPSLEPSKPPSTLWVQHNIGIFCCELNVGNDAN